MRTRWRTVTAAILLYSMAGCSNDASTGPRPEQITGVWNATKVEYVSMPAGTAIDLVALGGTGTLTLNDNDTFRFVVAPFAEAQRTTEGTWTLSSDILNLTPQGMLFSWQFDVAYFGDSLGLSGASVEYDFNEDGTPDQATLNLLLAR